MTKKLLLLFAIGTGMSWLVWHMHRAVPQASATSYSSNSTVEVREIHGIGYIEPASEIRQLAPRLGGVIKQYHYKVGDRVEKGAVILELEDASQRAEVALAEKQLAMIRCDAANVQAGINQHRIQGTEESIARIREKLRHYQAECDRYRAMRNKQSVSQQEHEAVETMCRQTEIELREQQAELKYLKEYVTPENYAWQQARIAHAEAGLLLARERLEETRILAPCDGTILRIIKREGEGVAITQPEAVLMFGDLTAMRIRAEIDERFVQDLVPGQTALIHGRNLSGKTYRGKIAYREHVMGDKTVFTRASSERKDLEVLQIVIDMEPSFSAPSGLRVDVTILNDSE